MNEGLCTDHISPEPLSRQADWKAHRLLFERYSEQNSGKGEKIGTRLSISVSSRKVVILLKERSVCPSYAEPRAKPLFDA